MVLIAIILLFGALLVYAIYSGHLATIKAENFCRSLTPGADAAPLLEQALSEGANARQTRWFAYDGQDNLPVTFIGFTPIDRYICLIKAENGRVVSSKLMHLD